MERIYRFEGLQAALKSVVKSKATLCAMYSIDSLCCRLLSSWLYLGLHENWCLKRGHKFDTADMKLSWAQKLGKNLLGLCKAPEELRACIELLKCNGLGNSFKHSLSKP